MQLIECFENFTENRLKAYIEDELFNYAKPLLIKDGGI